MLRPDQYTRRPDLHRGRAGQKHPEQGPARPERLPLLVGGGTGPAGPMSRAEGARPHNQVPANLRERQRREDKQMSAITVWYTCKQCGLVDQKLEVPERKRAVDIVYWVQMVSSKVGQDHAERRPLCKNDKVDLMIPVSKDGQMLGRK